MISYILKHKQQIIELIIIFTITIIFTLIYTQLNYDECWNYGFSYNISQGLIPYKDFNLIITPLYPILGAIFMSILGKNIIVYYIFNSLICTIIFYFMKKYDKSSVYLVYTIFLSYAAPNYNILCILFLYILIYLEIKDNKDFLIGVLLGLTILTKQNIGIYLCLPTLLITNKNLKKRISGLILPILILLIYLLSTNSIHEFIDYTILGLNNFTQNTKIELPYLIILIITTIYHIYKYLKTKDKQLLYIISIQGMSIPIVDSYHVTLPFIVSLSVIFKNIKIDKRFSTSFFLIFITLISTINIYQFSNKQYIYPNNSNTYKYKKINTYALNEIINISNYVKTVEGKLYIIDKSAYLIKLETNIPINKYDLLNNGNLGQNGHIKLIQELEDTCNKEKCTFLLNEKILTDINYSQYNQDICKYIKETYQYNNKINSLSIYTN